MEPIRILHIVGRMDRAGAETMLMNLYRAIDRERFQFDFACFTLERCDYDKEIEALGGRIIRIRGGNPLQRFLGLWRHLRRGEWRIVHSHTLFSSALHLLAAKLAAVPARIAHAHNTADRNSRTALGRGYQWACRKLLRVVPTDFVACGRAAAAYMFPGRSDVALIPNAIDVPAFVDASSDQIREELGIVPGNLLAIQIGRLDPVKNHVLSLSIAEALKEAGRPFHMLFIGSGRLQAELEVAVRARGLEQHVRLLGVRSDIPAIMAAADVLLMPSLHEGFPVVLVESQAAGLTCVVSSAVSPEVDLGLGLTKFVDLSRSPGEWANALLQAATRPRPKPDIRRSTLDARGFSVDASARRLAQMYTAL